VDKNTLAVNTSLDMQAECRDRYSYYLRSMKQRIYDTYLGYNELEDERKLVNQSMKTPGRRRENIKSEEIDKEFSRSYCN
jgi:hypothetical protein